MLVAFWGPAHGQIRTTSNMLAITTILALDAKLRILIAHTHFEQSTLEKAYSSLRSSESDLFGEDIGGMDAILRLVQSGKINPESVKNNAEFIIKDRLDMLAGPSREHVSDFQGALPFILETSRKYYDISFFDISSGTRNAITNLVLKQADLIVVCLSQNRAILESVKMKQDWPDALSEKPLLYCIGSFEPSSNLTVSRIAKELNISPKDIGGVPHNVRYMDAQNDQQIVDFFLRVRKRKKRFLVHDEQANFVESTRNIGKRILSKLEIHPIWEGLE